MTIKHPRCYTICIGPFELRLWGDDRRAKRVAARWTRMFYAKKVANLNPSSIAAFVAAKGEVLICRHHYSPVRGVAGMGWSEVARWTVPYNAEWVR